MYSMETSTHQGFAGKPEAGQNGGVEEASQFEELVDVHHFFGHAAQEGLRSTPSLASLFFFH